MPTIAQLPTASALLGTEAVPIWQGDTTVQTTISQIQNPVIITPSMTVVAIQSAITAAGAEQRAIYAQGGTYPGGSFQLGKFAYLFGDGRDNTIFTPASSGDHVFILSASGGSRRPVLRDFSIYNSSIVGTGHGIYIPSGTAMYQGLFENISVAYVGGSAICDEQGAFNCRFIGIETNYTGSHGLDILGGNSNLFQSCYVHNLATPGTAGYRLRAGNPTLMSCNGLDSVDHGSYWGDFGASTTDGDPIGAVCNPTLIGCNIEGFYVAGLRNRADNSVSLLGGNSFISYGTDATTAIYYETQPNQLDMGVLAGYNAFFEGPGGWANGYAIHSRNGAPFIAIGQTYTMWDDQNNVSYVGPSISRLPATSGRIGITVPALAVAGGICLNGVASPPAQVTGWGTPTGGAVQSNFSASTATLGEVAAALAEIITYLKARGDFGT